jgi:DNA-binding transcriptional MerR regulator
VISTLAIGDFSRATHLSAKMLRHYHELGLLEPADVDVKSGYRRYAAEQIVTAQVIRRFRDLDMPLEEIQIVLQAPDVETRNRVIANHLARLESNLARTQETVASLRGLLDRPKDSSVPINHRYVAATPAAVITDIVDKADVVAWYRGAMGEVAATLSAQDINPAGPSGASSTRSYSPRTGDGSRSSFHATRCHSRLDASARPSSHQWSWQRSSTSVPAPKSTELTVPSPHM